MLEVDLDLDPIIATEGDAHSSSERESQPPRYTIFGAWAPVPGAGDEETAIAGVS